MMYEGTNGVQALDLVGRKLPAHGGRLLRRVFHPVLATLDEAQDAVLAYVKRFVPEPKTAPLCGNSIATDRGFLARDMPALDEHLHYRMVDVSSVKELARRWYPRVYYAKPEKGLAHRALADIVESVQELDYYRRAMFVAPPGPSSDEAKAAANAVLAESPSPLD